MKTPTQEPDAAPEVLGGKRTDQGVVKGYAMAG